MSQAPVQTFQHAQQHGHGGGAPIGAAQLAPTHAAQRRTVGAAFVTGAYQPSGDAAIDRMVALEAACKRFGSLI